MQYTSSIICIYSRQTSSPVRHVSLRTSATTGSSTNQGARQANQRQESVVLQIQPPITFVETCPKSEQRNYANVCSFPTVRKVQKSPNTRVCEVDAQSVQVHTFKVHASHQLPDSRETLPALRVIRYSDTDSRPPQCRERRTNGTVEKFFSSGGRLLRNRGLRIATRPTLNRPNQSDQRVSYRYQMGGGHDFAEWPGAGRIR